MSRRLLLLGVNGLPMAATHGSTSLGLRSLHCLLGPGVSSVERRVTHQHQQVAAARRGLQQSASPEEPTPAGWDATRRQRPDLLYSKLELELRAHDPAVLDSYVTFLRQAARHLGITTGRLYEPPRHFERMSLLKSVHIFAKHKVQYEMRTYFRVLELLRLTGSTTDTYLEYSQRVLPEGVAMKVTRHAREPLPEHLSRRPAGEAEDRQPDGTEA